MSVTTPSLTSNVDAAAGVSGSTLHELALAVLKLAELEVLEAGLLHQHVAHVSAELLVRHARRRLDVQAVGDAGNAWQRRHALKGALLGLHTLDLAAQHKHAVAADLQLARMEQRAQARLAAQRCPDLCQQLESVSCGSLLRGLRCPRLMCDRNRLLVVRGEVRFEAWHQHTARTIGIKPLILDMAGIHKVRSRPGCNEPGVMLEHCLHAECRLGHLARGFLIGRTHDGRSAMGARLPIRIGEINRG